MATVDGSCVHMQKFAHADCSGPITENVNFSALNKEGSQCVAWGAFSFKDQHCNAEGTFKQSMFLGPGCLVGPVQSQEFERGVCQWGTKMSCDTQADCAAKSPPSDGQATVTLLKYATSDCSDEPSRLTFPTGIAKGSPCFDMEPYSVKDQYCDADGKFKQTVYAGAGCVGEGAEQIFDDAHCTYSFKLGSCVRSPSVQMI